MRNYSSITPELTLTAELTEVGTTLNVDSADNIPPVPFTLVLNPDTVKEEIVTVTEVSGLQFTVSRAEEGTAPAKIHLEGDKARHMITGRDLQDSQNHIDSTESVHGISDTAFLVYTNSSQTLTNKQLTSPRINESTAMTATSSELNILDGATVSTTELNYVTGVTSNIQSQFNNILTVPVGTVTMFAGIEAPSGYLFCNGASISRTAYPALFDAIGISYGSVDSSTFNLPDMRGRAPIGVGTGTGLTGRAIGATVGTETHVLTTAQLPSFSHEIQMSAGGNDGTTYVRGSSGAYSTSLTYSHGSGQAHPNMQPSLAVNFIIKH